MGGEHKEVDIFLKWDKSITLESKYIPLIIYSIPL